MELNPLNYSIKKLNALPLENGRLLIAEPFMQDPHFKRSIVFICEHNSDGTVGLVINKTVGLQINEVLEDFPPFDAEVFLGGPVQAQRLFFIHKKGDLIPKSILVQGDIYWSGEFSILKELIQKGLITPNDIRFFLGYSGWEPEQIIGELKEESWLISPSSSELLFGETDPDDLWAAVLKEKGDQFAMMANFPEDPSFN
ncbi:YqgE/AlgH family protein [bacterium]|nr:YqgE/AlgH family protein [bacterium]